VKTSKPGSKPLSSMTAETLARLLERLRKPVASLDPENPVYQSLDRPA